LEWSGLPRATAGAVVICSQEVLPNMNRDVVRRSFDQAASKYDTIKIQIVPKYREAERLLQGYVAFPKTRCVRILELGTGTGKWASGILCDFPKAHYHGVDFSEAMLQVASSRLRTFAGRPVILQKLDLNEETPTGQFDLIYSAFTIHHVQDKRKLFRSLRDLLKPRGLFLYMDITIASNSALESRFLKSWKRFMQKSPWPNHKIKRIIDDHFENDIPETVETQLKYLGETGYTHYDVVWRYEKFAAFHAQK